MRTILVVWVRTEEGAFEAHTALAFLARRNRILGMQSEVDVLFMEGLERLSPGYRETLHELGYILRDVAGLYKELEKKYRSLERFGDYETKCFLRWLVIRDYFGRSAFVHYDADIVFNVNPDEVDREVDGLTFVLQGCPAYTRVADTAWLDCYEDHLNAFAADIDGYSASAWSWRLTTNDVHKDRNTALWARTIISSDQDLLRFLTLSNRIPQASSGELVKRTSMALFENPIEIHSSVNLQYPLTYRRVAGIDYLNDQRVAVWHMQSDFCDYLGFALYLADMGIKGRVPWIRQGWPADYTIYKSQKQFSNRYLRGGLIQRFFSSKDDFTFLFNDKTYWREETFV